MKHFARRTIAPALGLVLLLGACGAAPNSYKGKSAGRAAPEAAAMRQGDMAQAVSNLTQPAQVKPRLIKTASMRLTVREIDTAIAELRKILSQQQGDIYNFNDFRGGANSRRRVDFELKVPQGNLDQTLEAVGKLGNVINTKVSSQDVTDQIVDTDARLQNLRKQEAMTQKLMDRSGSLKDVLAVSNQLSQVREKIERLDAQVKRLKSQVAYSTINLQMSGAIAGGKVTNNPFGLQVQDTWNRSTRGASQLMIGLLLFGVGLIPFLPFLLLLVGAVYILQRRLRRIVRSRQPKTKS
ncbi:DUF4349 domain-containing protein [filamentous cyanobacterium LEGE 11480]|uniref:DUF4349 domain-containing protein n=1 Tax=Romeriopsis navalis LEGE 11480 TaxID=2777977 RepID=A0A928VIW4_9CYAN|nr:DUF4349 domain-containing protein [Romeriopsis navalis]MBE9029160.1 DUF4349 domain-containing protein [Romeriopsis navalis LEGE 11480]